MADVILRNLDLMSGLTKRNPIPQSQVAAALPTDGRMYSRILWDDLILVNAANLSPVTQLGGLSSIVNCTSIGLQLSSFGTPMTFGANVVMAVRDGSAGYNASTGQIKGFELVPGEGILFEVDEADADGKLKYLEPKNFSIQIIFPSLLITAVTVHVGYGVLSQ